MAETKPTTLESYRRANKERKSKMMAKAGYKTEAGYLKSLGAEPKVKKVVVKKGASKIVKNATKKAGNKVTDYVIAFDVTSSMSRYIQSVKSHVNDLINKLFDTTPDLKIKLVAFGDYCDMASSKVFGDAYQEIELTNDKQALIDFVNTARNTSGGDADEFYELVIKKINEETKWRNGNRAVLLIGDAGFHSVGYSYREKVVNAQIDWEVEAEKAKSLGIQYDTLMINKNYTWYTELSQITGGVSMDFQSASKISDIIEGTISVRSNKAAYAAKSAIIETSGDAELIGAYKTMSSLL